MLTISISSQFSCPFIDFEQVTMMTIWLKLLVCSILACNICLAGNVLFYIPFAAKSSTLTIPPIANELVERGHNVAIVTPWNNLNFDERVNQIIIENTFDSTIHNNILDSSTSITVLWEGIQNLVGDSFRAAELAISHPKLNHLMNSKELFFNTNSHKCLTDIMQICINEKQIFITETTKSFIVPQNLRSLRHIISCMTFERAGQQNDLNGMSFAKYAGALQRDDAIDTTQLLCTVYYACTSARLIQTPTPYPRS